MYDGLLNNIVDKLVAGNSDWTLEELQFQRNYPDEIELALKDFQREQQEKSRCILHSGHNLLQRGRRRGLTYPEAIVLALFAQTQLKNDTKVAVFAFDDDFLDMAVVGCGDGVFEVVYTAYSPLVNSEVVYSICHEAIKYLEEPIDRLLVVTNGYYKFTYEHLAGSIFGVKAELMTNQKELLNRGVEIQNGVLKGTIKDVLLLPVISQTIGIEGADGEILPIVKANTMIPCQFRHQIMLDAGAQKFSVDIWQGNNTIAKKNALIACLSVVNERIQSRLKRMLDVVIDIDSKMYCQCCLVDTVTGRKNDIIV